MFLWWQNTFGSKVETDLAEETKQEIAELEEIINNTALTRPSTVSKSKYNKWAVTEQNRAHGEGVRSERDALQHQKQAHYSEIQEGINERTQAIKDQREAAIQRVRQHKTEMGERGSELKRELTEQKHQMEANRQAILAQGVKTAQAYGAELRERLMESKNEAYENRHRAVLEHKEGEAQRAADHAAKEARNLEERRQRVARIRAETEPEVAQRAKEDFANQRKAVADDVRASVRDWKSESDYKKNEALEKARHVRDNALAVQQSAVDHQASLKNKRREDAQAMRDNIQSINDRKQLQKLSLQASRRELHDDAFEAKFVASPNADAVITSSYDAIANTHRDELAAREGKPGRVIGKPDWIPFLHPSGWFFSA